MFQLTIDSSGLDNVRAKLEAITNFEPDFSGIEQEIRNIVQEEHKKARLAGVDVRNDILIPITMDTVRRRRQLGKGTGPALCPDEDSRILTQFLVTTESHDGRIDIRVGYIGMPWMEMHRTGGPHLPPRDVIGIQPEALERIRALVAATALRQIDEFLQNTQSNSTGILARIRGFFGR